MLTNEKSARRPSTVAMISAGVGDHLLEPRAGETSDLERVVRRVQTSRHVDRTETDIVFSTPFERWPLPILPAADDPAKSGGPPGA